MNDTTKRSSLLATFPQVLLIPAAVDERSAAASPPPATNTRLGSFVGHDRDVLETERLAFLPGHELQPFVTGDLTQTPDER